jgi:hypothetical protein
MHTTRRSIFLCALCVFAAGNTVAADFFGPTPYVQRSDTPAAFSVDSLDIEDFEDGLLDPRLIPVTPVELIGPGGLTDSVDADDGLIDGSGINGRSLFSGVAIRIEFASPVLQAALVWTDGGFNTQATIEAFDPLGESLGTHGPFTLGDGSNGGTTAEDRFFGVIDDSGIGAIEIRHTSGGYEIDHIQWLEGSVFRDGFEE